MENRLCLNKKPVYELPCEVFVEKYNCKTGIPDFEPDLCLTCYGRLKIREKLKTSYQIWIKTDNVELVNFIKSFDWEDKIKKTKEGSNIYNLPIWRLKKIILEEFYGVKNGE